jgi:hypothetical protein
MSESTPSSTSKRFCDVFQMTSKQRGKITQTGSERGTFSYRQQHPNHPELVFSYYRKRSDGSYFEVWMLAEEMELRHQQRVARNLARARARGVPPRKPAAPKEERLKKARVRQEKTRQRHHKQRSKLTPEEDIQRWQVLAEMLGKPVEQIMPK